MTTTKYKLAGVSTIVRGDNKYAEKLREYFSIAMTDSTEPADIIINICDNDKDISFERPPFFYAEGKGLQVNNESFIAGYGRCRYRVDNLFVKNEPVTIWLYYDERSGIRKIARNILAYTDPYMIGRETEEDRFIADTLNYEVLWWILALAFLKYNRAFVHSGMAAKNSLGVVVSGTGGCGKTSSVSELIGRGWKYIAEDFGIMCSDGTIWSIPKRGAISAEDVSYGSERLVNIINSLSFGKRFRWNRYTKQGKNPLISPSLEDLYGKENIAEQAKLWKTVCVARSSKNTIEVKKVSADEIATRMMGAAFRVIREMYNVLHNLFAIADEDCRTGFPPMREIEERYCEIIKQGIKESEYYVLEVPLKVNPKLINEAIIDEL